MVVPPQTSQSVGRYARATLSGESATALRRAALDFVCLFVCLNLNCCFLFFNFMFLCLLIYFCLIFYFYVYVFILCFYVLCFNFLF